MTPTEIHAILDRQGLLEDARGPGVYALAVDVPDSVETVQRRWMDRGAEPLPDHYAAQLAAALDVEYVGASKQVYNRLQDHARGEVRKASLLSVFDVAGVRGVWPAPDKEAAFIAETQRVDTRARGGRLVWCNGDLF